MNLLESDLQSITCGQCGSALHLPLYERPDGLKVVRCQTCGLAFLNPRPNEESILKTYNQGYFSGDSVGDGIGYGDYLSPHVISDLEETAQFRFNLLSRYLRWPGLRVLEVGCASGEFCVRTAQAGARIVGLDLSPEIIEIARRRYRGVDFYSGAIETTSALQNRKFDLIAAFEVIEHVPDPKVWLAALSSKLAPGGSIALSTPNLNCGARIGFDRWVGFQSSFEHLYYFTPDTLSRMLEEAGFACRATLSFGSGDRPTPNGAARSAVKRVLCSLGLWGLAKKARGALNPIDQRVPISEDGNGHTMLLVATNQGAFV
ncbi:MAG: class I SAM-dependent methyltransferase [Acidobacteria bacterium]|nr:class I SAM-dependent methyltransferase [Acidobacteriota bacterium]